MMTAQQVAIRWAIRRDIEEIVAIEAASFPDPWSEADFLYALKQRNCIGKVAEIDGKIVGFLLYENHKDKVTVIDMAIAPAWRRHGIASQFIWKTKTHVEKTHRSEIWIDVSDANLGAQLFLRASGFKCENVLREHYENGDDAYRFVWMR